MNRHLNRQLLPPYPPRRGVALRWLTKTGKSFVKTGNCVWGDSFEQAKRPWAKSGLSREMLCGRSCESLPKGQSEGLFENLFAGTNAGRATSKPPRKPIKASLFSSKRDRHSGPRGAEQKEERSLQASTKITGSSAAISERSGLRRKRMITNWQVSGAPRSS